MEHCERARHRGVIGAAVCVAAMALSGCGRPAAQKESPAASVDTPEARAIPQNAGQSPVGLNEPCVGLGCDGKVSVGLKEKCVGMGCPPADAKQPE